MLYECLRTLSGIPPRLLSSELCGRACHAYLHRTTFNQIVNVWSHISEDNNKLLSRLEQVIENNGYKRQTKGVCGTISEVPFPYLFS